MLADFFTKPLQGSQFKKFRDVILGYEHVDSLTTLTPPPASEERVGSDMRTDDGESGTTDADGFTLVTSRKKNKVQNKMLGRGVYGDHGELRENLKTNVCNRRVNDVSRDHSLETIQLTN